VKPKLLVLELWRVGDLAIATPFLRHACRSYAVTLLAQPMALSYQPRFWPEVEVIPFVLPWTAFHGKYRLHRWPWRNLTALCRQLRARQFDCAMSARWDPRDHMLLWLAGAKERLGFPRWGSQWLLTQRLRRLSPLAHRYDDWWVMGRALNLDLPDRKSLGNPAPPHSRTVLIHTGAGAPLRVWPLERYRRLAQRLQEAGYPVRLACDANQKQWWLAQGQADVTVPGSIEELFALLESGGVFIGNDSGPGHVAALLGIPTFTLFGPQLSEWFAPLHPQADWIDGKPCPYKPCSDSCRYPIPHCIQNITEAEAWDRVSAFLDRLFPGAPPVADPGRKSR
jgi:heptosyltransferase-2